MPKQNLYLLENFVVAASNFGANRRFPRSPLNNRSRLRHILQSAYRIHLIADPRGWVGSIQAGRCVNTIYMP